MKSNDHQDDALTLSDFGEFRLLNEIVLPTLNNGPVASRLGDDCAYVPVPNGRGALVFTSDAAPRPLIWHIGESDYQTWGWYGVVINLSDLAAAGAHPIAFTSSVEAPSSMKVCDFKAFFDGIAEACKQFATPNGGGNIRMASTFGCHGTAIGLEDSGEPLTRRGCKSGDLIVSVGTNGMFISAFLKAQNSGFSNLAESERAVLLRPRPRLKEMQLLHRAGFLTAASDNSDGVLGAMWNIAERSDCAIELNVSDDSIPAEVLNEAKIINANPWNLMFCWGDWQVIVSVKSNQFQEFKNTAETNRIPYLTLGVARTGEPSIRWKKGRAVPVVRNENFATSSFNSSIEANLSYMLHTPLY